MEEDRSRERTIEPSANVALGHQRSDQLCGCGGESARGYGGRESDRTAPTVETLEGQKPKEAVDVEALAKPQARRAGSVVAWVTPWRGGHGQKWL